MSSKSPKTLPCGRQAVPSLALPTAEKFAEWQTRLRKFLAEHTLKYSEQRWKIAQIILSTAGHLDSQEIVDKVKRKHPAIGAATVYRNIKVLCEAKILKESLNDLNGRVVYELFDEDHHDHIVCTNCGEIFEFHSEKIESLQDEITQKLGFTPVRHRHVIYARCKYAGTP
jgi:Fur family ferric uptake transcriptional regulator